MTSKNQGPLLALERWESGILGVGKWCWDTLVLENYFWGKLDLNLPMQVIRSDVKKLFLYLNLSIRPDEGIEEGLFLLLE